MNPQYRIIAIDFDNTLFNIGRWPEILDPRSDIINAAKLEQKNGSKLVLYSAREGQQLEDAVDACAEQGLLFDAVNENIQEITRAYGYLRKVVANEYWDDRSVSLDDVVSRYRSAYNKKEM